MITKNNLQEVINLLSKKDKKRVLNSNKEYAVLYLHTFNSGSYTTIRLTDDFNRYKNVSNFGDAILYVEEVKNLIIKGITEKVLDYAAKNKSGFSLNINTLQPVSSGYVVAYEETQDSHTAIEVQNVIIHALMNNCVVGGWFNDKNKKFYFDSSKVFSNVRNAIDFAIKNNQLAIYDIDNNHTIWMDSL